MNFNRVAPYFEPLEKIVFRNQMQLCRTAYLSDLPSLRKVAVIGEGDGRFLLDILKQTQCPKVHYIDSSQVMLELAQSRIRQQLPEALSRVHFYLCDLANDDMPDDQYDLIATNFFLDVFNEPTLKATVSKIARSCSKNAIWLYADFQVSGGKLKQLRALAWLKTMYLFFKLAARIQAPTLIDPASLLETHGFQLINQTEFARGLMRAEFRKRV
ncbi:Methyltransferase domain protein [Gimesia panareensis]|nr:Methyltransferase domain protein [Gimesia panareensis]